MNVRRYGLRAAAVTVVTSALCGVALAQAPAPQPSATEDPNRAILRPLVEIGRVRARSPYCAALARARAGSDTAVAYEYQARQVDADLRAFRFDSALHRDVALRRAEKDVQILWQLANAGRTEVRDLRTAADAPGLDPKQRAEMLAYADALDGAKARQAELAKSVARTVGIFAEVPISTVVTNQNDAAQEGSATAPRMAAQPVKPPSELQPTVPFRTQTMQDTVQSLQLTQDLFDSFRPEIYIKSDLANASKHGTNAMTLGGCAPGGP
jgi:hypothetical protein